MDSSGTVWSSVFPLRSPLVGPKLCPLLILANWIFAITIQLPHYFVSKFVDYPEKLACELCWNEVFDEFSSYFFSKLHYSDAYNRIIHHICIDSIILYSIFFFKLKTQNVPGEQSPNTREFKQITAAGASTAAVTEKVWREYVSVVCQSLAKRNTKMSETRAKEFKIYFI